MKIRSITCFVDPSNPSREQRLKVTGDFLDIALPAFSQAGYEVQTTRLACPPFTSLLTVIQPEALVKLAQQLETAASDLGFAYLSLGPAIPEQSESYGLIPEALAATQNVFFGGSMTTSDGRISLNAIHQCAGVIKHASTISADGFANLRFAALSNVPAGSPFFPAAYHRGGETSFALATEAADLAVTAFSQANNLEDARRNLVMAMEAHAHDLADIARQVELESGVKFSGIDFSLAPYPKEERSIGTALERLGVPLLGDHGSLAASAILAETMEQATFPRIGFSGLFLPVLEDAVLARRVADGSLGLKDLLLYCAVCGTGLDTIPLPGDITVGQISALLLDVASLSSRLSKPLTARLMPIPGKQAGDPTGFDFDYFANSRVMSISADPLNNLLASEESFSIHKRSCR